MNDLIKKIVELRLAKKMSGDNFENIPADGNFSETTTNNNLNFRNGLLAKPGEYLGETPEWQELHEDSFQQRAHDVDKNSALRELLAKARR